MKQRKHILKINASIISKALSYARVGQESFIRCIPVFHNVISSYNEREAIVKNPVTMNVKQSQVPRYNECKHMYINPLRTRFSISGSIYQISLQYYMMTNNSK